MVYMMRVIGTSSLAVNSPPGSRRPLHTMGVGKAYLGGLLEEELNTLLAKLDLHTCTPNSITSLRALKADIRKGRARGYYVDEQETDARIRCLASPIQDALGRPIACIGVSGPADGTIFEDIEKLGSLVLEKAKLISRAIGYAIGTQEPQGFTTGASESPRNNPAR
jgi:IclR family acetate operon transcriptional repressor